MAGENFLQKNLTDGKTYTKSATQSGGEGNENKIPALGADGRLALTMMPSGIGATTKDIPCSEALSAGNVINPYLDTTLKVRKADATTDKRATGFVLASYESLATATVQFEGIITGLTGLTPGSQYYLSKTAGGITTDVSSYTTGNIIQYIGQAISDTELKFEPGEPIVIA